MAVQGARHSEADNAGLYGEEMIHQFSFGKYRIDLCFRRYKLAIECDEFDHRDRDIEYEVEQQKFIED